MFHSQKRAAYHSSSQSQDNAFRDLDLDLDLDMDLDLDLELSDDDMNTQKSTAEGAKGKEKKETEEEIKKFRYPFDASVNETGVTVLMDMDKFWDKNSALQPKQAENVDAENPVIEAGTREVWVGEEWPTIEQVEYNENLTFPKRKKGAQDIVPEKVWVIKPKPPPKKKPKKNLGSQIGKHAKQRKMPTVIGHSQPKKRHGFKVSRQKKSGSSQTTSRSQTVRFADSEAQSQQQSQTQDYTQSNSQAHSRSGSQSAQSSQSQSQSQSQFESQPQSDFGSQSQSQSQSHSQYRAKGKHKKKHKKDKHKKDKHKSNKRRMGF
ncbi:hypothetical protein SARC_09756 [Sphaeroforma arctica JP610]|uniref:Uncharacterized protein n=1 Tax=Sphaeroforma arctica JP610 TaxID=667725 RepID=A0A0L0FP88_9EUKA|nr:hypothetical protein SARC_09756 [Sphaeroforma arctica JP610]KNC77793.1 hypothetical protein SARC_09756 [Sphaeroforma arctica JP610]|eukprot:XP_014151695.1 hypothetical protein SARC_09756 [Sphaeroforma arctica JP610]